MTSDDPIPDLVDRLLARSPLCDVFDLVNVVHNRTARPIDISEEAREEPSLAASFAEWRATAANAAQRRAPDEAVVALLELALGAAGDESPDLGTASVASEVESALSSLTEV